MRKRYCFLALLFFILLVTVGCSGEVDVEWHTDPELFYENPESFISIAVFGKDNETIIEHLFIEYRENTSVADLTAEAGRIKSIPVVFAGMGTMRYVRGINNLFEFDHGAGSGWLYAINKEFMGVGIGNFIVSPGDRVSWHYTLDLGNDLGAGIGVDSR